MKRILAIRTEEEEYGEELAKQFNRKTDWVFHSLVFTDEQLYRDFEENNRIDMLLCDENLLKKAETPYCADSICMLTECGFALEEEGEYPAIFKYQASEQIMKEILKNYGKRQENLASVLPERQGRRRIYSIISPVGGSHSSTFALALAYYFSLGEKTLFISLDPFFSLPGEEKHPKEKNLSDLIYYLEQTQGKDMLSQLRGATVSKGNLDCISGVSHWFDLCDMNPSHMSAILDAIYSAECYSSIVFDVGITGQAIMEIFLVSDTIFVPVGTDFASTSKYKEWRRQIQFVGQAQLLDKVKEIYLPHDEILENEYTYEQLLKGRIGKLIEESEGMQYIR